MKEFQKLKGVYLGQAPTDESALAFGEFKVVIDDDRLTGRMAAGFHIKEMSVEQSKLKPMTPEEIAPSDPAGLGSRVTGFKLDNGLQFLFITKPSLVDPSLMIRGNEMADILGLTVLYRQGRFAYWLFKLSLWWCELKTKGGIPRLRYGGQARRSN